MEDGETVISQTTLSSDSRPSEDVKTPSVVGSNPTAIASQPLTTEAVLPPKLSPPSPQRPSLTVTSVKQEEVRTALKTPILPSPAPIPLAEDRRRDPDILDRELIEQILSANRAIAPPLPTSLAFKLDLVAEMENSSATREESKLNQALIPLLQARIAVDADSLERKNAVLVDEYKSYHESWTLHRQRLERLEAVRTRKQGLLGGDEGQNRGGRRGAISLGDAARSDLELDQIMASLVNEDLTNPEILSRKNIASIPDMLSVTDPRQLEVQFDDRNGLVTDPEFFTHQLHDAGYWTESEQTLFIDAYLASPKQFGRIAEKIPHKTPEQCVLYYYLHKKEINFKGLISKQGPRKGRRGGRRAKAKGNALLKDLQAVMDEEESAMDSSPTPDNPGGTSYTHQPSVMQP